MRSNDLADRAALAQLQKGADKIGEIEIKLKRYLCSANTQNYHSGLKKPIDFQPRKSVDLSFYRHPLSSDQPFVNNSNIYSNDRLQGRIDRHMMYSYNLQPKDLPNHPSLQKPKFGIDNGPENPMINPCRGANLNSSSLDLSLWRTKSLDKSFLVPPRQATQGSSGSQDKHSPGKKYTNTWSQGQTSILQATRTNLSGLQQNILSRSASATRKIKKVKSRTKGIKQSRKKSGVGDRINNNRNIMTLDHNKSRLFTHQQTRCQCSCPSHQPVVAAKQSTSNCFRKGCARFRAASIQNACPSKLSLRGGGQAKRKALRLLAHAQKENCFSFSDWGTKESNIGGIFRLGDEDKNICSRGKKCPRGEANARDLSQKSREDYISGKNRSYLSTSKSRSIFGPYRG